jgi:hypothetical protein
MRQHRVHQVFHDRGVVASCMPGVLSLLSGRRLHPAGWCALTQTPERNPNHHNTGQPANCKQGSPHAGRWAHRSSLPAQAARCQRLAGLPQQRWWPCQTCTATAVTPPAAGHPSAPLPVACAGQRAPARTGEMRVRQAMGGVRVLAGTRPQAKGQRRQCTARDVYRPSL